MELDGIVDKKTVRFTSWATNPRNNLSLRYVPGNHEK
jgi:hypothetical protein